MTTSSAVGVQARSEELGLRSRNAVQRMLQRRVANEGTIAHAVEDGAKRVGSWLWLGVRRHSLISVTAAGAAGVALATVVGVGELAVGAAVAYTCYNVWVRGESREQAIGELAKELEGEH